MGARRGRANLEALLEAEGDALVRTAIAMALAGDGGAMRMALDRLMPPPKERAIKVELPPIEDVQDLPAAIGAVVGRVAAGELAPSEGTALCGMLSSMRSAFELVDLAARLEAVERALPRPLGPASGGYP